MSNTIVASNTLYNFYQDIKNELDRFQNTKKGATSSMFFEFMRNKEANEQISSETMRRTLVVKMIECLAKLKKSKDLDSKYFNEQQDALKSRILTLTGALVCFVLGFIAVYIIIIKKYKTNVLEGIKIVILVTVFMQIIVFLYGFLIRKVNLQVKKVLAQKKKSKKMFDLYYEYAYKDMDTDSKNILEGNCVYLFDKKSVSAEEDKKLIEVYKQTYKTKKGPVSNETIFINSYWSFHEMIIKNVYRDGVGLMALKVLQALTSDIKALRSVNEILDKYYELLLKSTVPSDSLENKQTALKTIDNNVIIPLKTINLLGMMDNKPYDDDILKSKIEDGHHFGMLISGFRYFIVFMYLVFRNTPYSKISEIQNNKEIDISNEDMKRIKSQLDKYKSLESAFDNYPIKQSNMRYELQAIQMLGNSKEALHFKDIIEKFMIFTEDEFKKIDAVSITYYNELNKLSTNDVKETQSVLEKFARTEFKNYFTNLYKNVIDYEFANFNAAASQYFLFNKTFMKSVLESIFIQYPFDTLEMEEVQDNIPYKTVIMNLIDEILISQKDEFVKTYFDYTRVEDPAIALKDIVFQNNLNKVMEEIKNVLLSKQIKLSDYTDYIKSNLVGKTDNQDVTNKLQDIIVNIDSAVALQKEQQLKSKIDPIETRFVSFEEFTIQLNELSIKTFHRRLQADTLYILVKNYTFAEQQEETFLDKDYNNDVAKWSFRMFTFILILMFVWYCVNLYIDYKEDKKEKTTKEYINYGVKVLFPFAALFLVISIFNAYVNKGSVDNSFNKDRMQENTQTILSELDTIKTLMMTHNRISPSNAIKKIGDVSIITDAWKKSVYDSMKRILIAYDKCNHIIGYTKFNMPFPYAEVFTDLFMVLIIIGIIGFCIMNFQPVKRITELKELYEYKEMANTLANDASFIQEIQSRASLNTAATEMIVNYGKIIGVIFIIIFMFVYSSKVMDSNRVYASGLNNLKNQNKCVR